MFLLTLGLFLQLPTAGHDSLRAAMLAAEDGRARTPAQLATLTGALTHGDTVIQRLAVRALGRLERPELLDWVATRLSGTVATVRLEAANALAQSVYRGDGGPALALLRSRAAAETSPVVRGGVLAAIGRLRLVPGSASAREAELILGDGLAADGAHLTGALRGAWDFYRRQGRNPVAPPAMVAHLRRRALDPTPPPARRLALMSLLILARADSAVLESGLRAPDEQLRRVAAGGLRSAAEVSGRLGLIQVALTDRSALVRIEAVRAWTAHGRIAQGCEPLVAATRDTVIAVQLLAIEGLGAGCGAVRAPVDLLDAIASEALGEDRWHRPVRALQALAQADTARAAIRLGGFARSPIWWVRAHTAAVALRLRNVPMLHLLLADSADNVRTAALAALIALEGRGADSVAVRQLERDDYQLVLIAAVSLRNVDIGPTGYAAAHLALQRITAERTETSRDTRLALLDILERDSGAGGVPALRTLLEDFDPAVAERAAALLRLRSDSTALAAPRPLPEPPLPTPADLREMREAVIVLRGGGRLVVKLHPEDAPASVARFVAMARAGWFAGLTLHRVVPNFVVQGGSPGANEYAGGADFSRDEVGGSHVRGSIGISTRGRDTGDGQLFINLVDNLNLDHEYTVIGEMTGSLELLESIREGAVIERIEVPGKRGA